VGRLAAFVFLDIPLARRTLTECGLPAAEHPRWGDWCWSRIRGLARRSAPLGVVALLGTIYTSAPRIVLERVQGIEAVGYFAAVASVLAMLGNIMTPLIQSVISRMSILYVTSRSAYTRLLLRLSAVGCFLGGASFCVTFFFGRQLLMLMFTPDYARYANVLNWVMVAGAFFPLFITFNAALSAMRRFDLQLPVHGAAALMVVVASRCLIPQFGMQGAALAMAGCYGTGMAIAMVLHAVVLRRSRPR